MNPPAQPARAHGSEPVSGEAATRALSLLQNSELFGRLDTTSLAALAEKSRFVEYARKESIVAPAERPQGIYLVESGLVKLVFYSYRGHEKSIALLGAGKAFGQAECFSGKPMHCHALCLLPARVLLLGKTAVRSMAETNAQFGLCIIDCLSRQYDALVRDIKYTSGYGASQRIVSFLLYRAAAEDELSGVVELETTKAAVAGRLGLSPESFSRTLRYLSSRGLITVHKRTITIPDIPRLEDLLEKSLDEGRPLASR